VVAGAVGQHRVGVEGATSLGFDGRIGHKDDCVRGGQTYS
jgi:hypothetical protein